MPCCCGEMQVQQREEGMGPPTPNVPTSHPGGKRIVCNHHTISPATIRPPLPQRAQHNRTASGLRPHLHRAQYPPTNILLPSPPPGPHMDYHRHRRSCRAVLHPQKPSIGQARRFTAVHDAGEGPLGNGTRSPIQRISRGTYGPTGPHGDHHVGDPSHNTELRAGGWGLLGI